MPSFEELNKFFKGKIDIEAAMTIILAETGQIQTICGKCGKPISFKLLDFSEKNPHGKNYTKKCACGIEINYYNLPDKFHKTKFYLRVFRSKFQEKEKNYLKKVFENGRTIFIKE